MTERATPAATYLSLGWGVQSFTLAAMVALGELQGLTVAEAVLIPEDFGAEQLGFEFEQPCDSGHCFT